MAIEALETTILPKAFHDTTVTIRFQDRRYLLRTRVHWKIKAGYLIARLGIKLVDVGIRMTGMSVREEAPGENAE